MGSGKQNAKKTENKWSQAREIRTPIANKLEQKHERHIARVIARLLNDKTTYVRGGWE